MRGVKNSKSDECARALGFRQLPGSRNTDARIGPVAPVADTEPVRTAEANTDTVAAGRGIRNTSIALAV